MNPRPTPDDPRLVSLALGEIRGPAERAALEAAVAADPALAAALDGHRRMASALAGALRREPLPFVAPDVVAGRAVAGDTARRARRSGAGGLAVIRRDRTDTRLRFVPWAIGIGAAACVALLATHRPAAPEVAVRPETVPTAAPRGPMLATPSVKSLAALLPGLRDADGAFRPAGRAPLALSAAHARAYAAALRSELAAGRRPAPEAWRVDGLVNAFVTARPVAPGHRPVLVETALTDAPWDTSRRLMRVTVRAQGPAGETVARNVAASVDFAASGVKSWRVLGHDGKAAAVAGVALRGGDTVTTLYEIDPAPGDAVASIALRYAPATGSGAENVVADVKNTDRRALGATDTDTRFAAALAGYALGLGDRPASALAAAAGDDADRRAFAALAR